MRPWYTYKDSKALGKATADLNENRFGKPDLAPKIDLDEEQPAWYARQPKPQSAFDGAFASESGNSDKMLASRSLDRFEEQKLSDDERPATELAELSPVSAKTESVKAKPSLAQNIALEIFQAALRGETYEPERK